MPVLFLAFLFSVLAGEVIGDKVDRYEHCKEINFKSKLCNSSKKLNADIVKFDLDK